jgi:AraC-like DNA-binding protein
MPVSGLLRPTADAVRSDPADQRTLADWASHLGVSARTITRAFNAETGTSFARWVAAVRAQHASAFGVAFRRTTGLTPGTFRAR